MLGLGIQVIIIGSVIYFGPITVLTTVGLPVITGALVASKFL